MSNNNQDSESNVVDMTQDVYRELTIVVGPGVDGKAEIKYGRHTRSRRINEDGDVVVTKSVADRVLLPEPMEEDEIQTWLAESDQGQELLTRYGWNGEIDE